MMTMGKVSRIFALSLTYFLHTNEKSSRVPSHSLSLPYLNPTMSKVENVVKGFMKTLVTYQKEAPNVVMDKMRKQPATFLAVTIR